MYNKFLMYVKRQAHCTLKKNFQLSDEQKNLLGDPDEQSNLSVDSDDPNISGRRH